MKVAVGVLAGIGLLVGFLFLQMDDELNPDAKALMEQVAVDGDSRAYRYLMGIFVSAEDNPESAGAKRVADILTAQARSETATIEGLEYPHYPQSRKLALPAGPLFCRWREPGCVNQVFASPAMLDKALKRNTVLRERYRRFMAFDDYATLTIPAPDEPFPPFEYLQAGDRLQLLSVIALSQQGHKAQSMAMLVGHIGDLRRQLVRQDIVVGKVLFASLLSQALDVAAVLGREGKCRTLSLAPLSRAERSLEKAIARDVWGFHTLFQSLDGHGDFFHVGGGTPGWWVRLFFKPTMTTNALWIRYRHALALSAMSASDFADALSDERRPSPQASLLRNYAGQALVRVSGPEYQEYIALLHDLEAKIVLFNAFNGCQSVQTDVVQNPYYQAFSPAFQSGGEGQENTSVCFAGPLADERKVRCLRLAR